MESVPRKSTLLAAMEEEENQFRGRAVTGSLCSNASVWEAIDLSESFLVRCMHGDAASLSSSVLRRLHIKENGGLEVIGGAELVDMTASAAMVLVQSLKELGRTVDIFSELGMLCGSVAEIPCQVVLTGACMQLSEGLASNLKPILEYYLALWKVDEPTLVLKSCDKQLSSQNDLTGLYITIEDYLQVVYIYVIQLLGSALHNIDLAITWVENGEIPEEYRQNLLQKLHSLHTAKSSNSITEDKYIHRRLDSDLSDMNGTKESEGTHICDQNPSKSAIPRAIKPCIWWLQIICLRCGNSGLIFRCGKGTALGALVILICYILQKKRTVAKRMAIRQFNSIKRVLSDAWQLAFSVQVNPLAAIQPIDATAPPGRR